MSMSLRVDNGKCVFEPVVCGDILYESYYRGRCSRLSFDMFADSKFPVKEGDNVSLKVDGKNLFFGVVFGRRKNAEGVILYRTV